MAEKELTDENRPLDVEDETKEPSEPIGGGEEGDDGIEAKTKEIKEEKVDYKKLSTREVIKDALKKQREKTDKVEKPKAKDTESKSEVKEVDEKKAKPTDKIEKDTPTAVKSILKPPPGWTKEGKAEWDKLPENVKQSIAKREKEVSDGFAQYGKATKELEELNTVFNTREKELSQFGLSKAQIVGKFFEWADALSGPNKINAWIQLGKNYGISEDLLKQHYSKVLGTTQGAQPTAQPVAQQPNSEIAEIKQELGNFKQTLANQQQAEADNYMANWAKDKPYYNQVRHLMLAMFQSGALKLNSEQDLTEAYNRSCYADPTVRAELEEIREIERQETAKKALEQKEQQRLARLNKARSANVSIKSGAPASPHNPTKPNNTRVSVGDSIRQALQEIRAGE